MLFTSKREKIHGNIKHYKNNWISAHFIKKSTPHLKLQIFFCWNYQMKNCLNFIPLGWTPSITLPKEQLSSVYDKLREGILSHDLDLLDVSCRYRQIRWKCSCSWAVVAAVVSITFSFLFKTWKKGLDESTSKTRHEQTIECWITRWIDTSRQNICFLEN